MNPKYPVFIPTKGRWETPYTIKAMQTIGVPFKAVIEPQEAEHYSQVVDPADLLILPHRDKGLVTTRNWIWDYAQGLGVEYFWTFDDNIRDFWRLNRNQKARVADGTFLKIIEDFATRYENVAVAGMHYEMFAPKRVKMPPFELNTRVYSNMLIKTNLPYRNEGFYNDDTDLCLRLLKDGYCTVLFLAFLAKKIRTMIVKGGMTPHYEGDGRLKMAQELQAKHPDVTKITWKWGRWQHQVDYRPFKANRLKLKAGVTIPAGVNDYGMVLTTNASQK